MDRFCLDKLLQRVRASAEWPEIEEAIRDDLGEGGETGPGDIEFVRWLQLIMHSDFAEAIPETATFALVVFREALGLIDLRFVARELVRGVALPEEAA